jgi:hypothetical protein
MLLPVRLDLITNPGQVKIFVFGVSFTHCSSSIKLPGISRQISRNLPAMPY